MKNTRANKSPNQRELMGLDKAFKNILQGLN